MSQSPKILVVDDESHILHVLSLKLRNAGYDVLTALDGEEGLDVAIRERPDLIITDYQMPYMTGLELCKALGNDAATAGIPVMMLTARGYALDSQDLALKNIRDVVSKPFSPRAIVEHIRRILETEGAGMRDQGSEQGAGIRDQGLDSRDRSAVTDPKSLVAHPSHTKEAA